MIRFLRKWFHTHDWQHRTHVRRCRECGRIEAFEADMGGWTAGTWEPADAATWEDAKIEDKP